MDFKYTVLITENAEKDIDEILTYISSDLVNKEAAKTLWDNIQDSLERISMFPYAMAIYKGKYINNDIKYRRLDINNFVLIYKVLEEKKEIRIMTVVYTPSSLSELFKNN